MQLSELNTWINSQKDVIEQTLKDLVEINTYTANEVGVDKGMHALAAITERLGFTTEVVNQRHRLIKAVKTSSKKPRIMLISHMDTVFPPDGDFLHYEDIGDGFVQGPGVGDIKGGLVMGLWAMLAITQLCDEYDVQMAVSANEEIGSPTIRDWYLGSNIGADFAIGLEPGFPQGELTADVPLGVVYQRRGYCAIDFTVYGKACHSGTPHLGLNAMEAMAHRITRIHALNDPENGISTNIGLVTSGISANTVPGDAFGKVSFRYERMSDGERIKEEVEKIICDSYISNPELDLQDHADFTIQAFIPPMEHSPENQKLIDVVLEQAELLGQNVVAIARGGGSDANFTSAGGTPSICGMGAPAQGIHTTSEKIYLPMLFERIELLTRTLVKLTEA